MKPFENINKTYNNVFKQSELSIGVVVPIERYATGSVPTMQDHVKTVTYIALQDDEAFKKISQMKKAMEMFKTKAEALEKELVTLKSNKL